jgi:FAD/FMN-containing dehydrogenase/Fe-S oxidoreductase
MNKPSETHLLAERIQKNSAAEVYTDIGSRGRYATDASIYQTIPIAVCVPSCANDITVALQVAKELQVPILPRGGGTSQCGQTTGPALVIDNSKHFRNLISVDAEEKIAVVEPGMVLDHLNAALKKHQLWFPVDVSTSGQATIGGMAGNNSCGSRSIAYGNMVHNVAGIEAWLASGELASFGLMENAKGEALRLGQLVQQLAKKYQTEIDTNWPKVLRRVAGYNLDIFHNQNEKPYRPDGKVNLAHLLVGSEGSLAYFKSLQLQLSPLPQHKTLGVINFVSFHAAMDSAQHIAKLGPTAIELVDRTMLDLGRQNPEFRAVIETALIDKNAATPEAILLVEFSGDNHNALIQQLKDLVTLMADLGLPNSVVEMTQAQMQKNLWEVRKAGLNIMMSLKGDGKPVSFIEDCAVPLEHLAEYTSALTDVFSKYGTRGTWYAHASVGTLHVRPILDMRKDGAQKMRAIAEEAAVLVRKYKGAFSGEHGDGISRGEWIKWQFGDHINQAFGEIKHAFDPQNQLNPGKIVNPPKMDDYSLMRFHPSYKVNPLQTSLDWSAWNVQNDALTEAVSPAGTGMDPAQGFSKAVEMCNNNGHCRKFDAGTMCPSYRVTRDEQHLTRGRANTLRLALSKQLEDQALVSKTVKDAMDLCVGCKGCKRECPTGVDMAKMKIEFLSHYQKEHGLSLRDRLFAYLPTYAHHITKIPGLPTLLNLRNRIPLLALLVERLLGISAKRSLPQWQTKTIWNSPHNRYGLEDWRMKSFAGQKLVVLFADTFNGQFESENLEAAAEVLEAAGYWVNIPRKPDGHYCCGKTLLSNGLVDEAKVQAKELLDHLSIYAKEGIPIIGLEPACILSLRDEYLMMGLGEQAEMVAKHSFTFEEFLMQEAAIQPNNSHQAHPNNLKFKATQQEILVHGHCHQKAFEVVQPVLEVLKMIPGANPKLIESSCCGMAGSFGYEAEHEKISMQMAEISLLPSIRNAPQAIIVADGSSCRHQIHDGLGRQALHIAKVLKMHLKE